ncbi:MAG: hypothetical protein U5K99_10100 [Anaerolineales bacterium]|nr:hypothetical protein [Anaerolineales bacterium]
MPQRVHLSVHIEGTTAAPFLNQLGNIYGKDHVLLYNNELKKLIRFSEVPTTPGQSVLLTGKKLLTKTPLLPKLLPGLKSPDEEPDRWIDKEEIPDDTAAIHGHITPDLFDGICENTFLSIVLREPLERMVIQYKQWKKAQGEVNWRVVLPYDSEITFPDFAFHKKYRNYQSKYMGDKRLGDFDVVGVWEYIDAHLCQLKNEDWSKVKISKNPIPYQRLLKDKKLALTENLIEEFKEYHMKDYYIYRQAKEFMGYA